jgi:carbonic anhydrase/acetyltransferase-like protein (isoleucine patch superfamily)
MIVGSPGRVVKTLSPEQAAMIAHGAAHYVDNWKRYARDLRVLG